MKSLSVIILAYNEVKNLRATYESTIRALRKTQIEDFEIIIVTNNRYDGTNDGTLSIADAISKSDSRVILIHNSFYVDRGYKFRQGVKIANKNYIAWIPGDNETEELSIENIFSHIGKAEMIISYTANKEARTRKRRFLSWGFTKLCNILFGLNLKYFSGICVYRREVLQVVPMSTDNLAYVAESIIYLVKSGVKYIEVPQIIKPTSDSTSFTIKNVFKCLGTLLSLFWKIHFQKQRIKT